MLLLAGTVLLVFVVASCKKDATATTNDLQAELSGISSNFHFNAPNSPVYEDTILCAKWRGPNKDYLARPLNNPPAGKYYSKPHGLVIDENTGIINVTKSEGGVRYVVGFVKNGTTDTAHTQVIISGIHYKDNIYVLANNDTLAIPYFNANPLVFTPCGVSDDTDYPGNSNGNGNPNAGCEYDDDEDDDNGNGQADEPLPGEQANDQNVRVRTKTGIINLKKTLLDGAFGPAPQNGTTKDVRIYYRLDDCSTKALRSIKVRLIYYEKKSDIPASLLAEVLQKKYNFENGDLIMVDYSYSSPRPPLIIVTSFE